MLTSVAIVTGASAGIGKPRRGGARPRTARGAQATIMKST